MDNIWSYRNSFMVDFDKLFNMNIKIQICQKKQNTQCKNLQSSKP